MRRRHDVKRHIRHARSRSGVHVRQWPVNTTSASNLQCDLYLPGHRVHWIQAKHAFGAPAIWGHIAGVGDNEITVDLIDRVGRYRTHDTTWFKDADWIGAKARVCESVGHLVVEAGPESSMGFSIALDDSEWVPCCVDRLESDIPETLHDRLVARGGFVVAGADVVEQLDG